MSEQDGYATDNVPGGWVQPDAVFQMFAEADADGVSAGDLCGEFVSWVPYEEMPDHIREGPVAFVSHSGSAFAAIAFNDRGIGFNLIVSSGQELVTTTADHLAYALSLPSTTVIGLVLETMRDALGHTKANVVMVGGAALAVALLVVTTLALFRLMRVAADNRRSSLRAVAALGAVWLLASVSGAQLLSHTPIASTTAAGTCGEKEITAGKSLRALAHAQPPIGLVMHRD